MEFGNFRIDEGVNHQTGVRTVYHFEGDQVVVQKQYDAEPYIKRAQEMRSRNEGLAWGSGKEVGVIPPWAHEITLIQDDAERVKAMRAFFRENPAFLAYDAFVR